MEKINAPTLEVKTKSYSIAYHPSGVVLKANKK